MQPGKFRQSLAGVVPDRLLLDRNPVFAPLAAADPKPICDRIQRAAGLLDRIAVRLVGAQELHASKGRELERFDQLLPPVTNHAEQIDDLPVQVVVDLGVAAGLAKQDRPAAPVGLHVDAVLREVRQDAGREFPLAAAVANDGALGLGHFTSPVEGGVISRSALSKHSWQICAVLLS